LGDSLFLLEDSSSWTEFFLVTSSDPSEPVTGTVLVQ